MKGEKPHQLIYLICTKIDQSESLLVVVYGEIITLACALSDDAARLKTCLYLWSPTWWGRRIS